MADLDGGAVTTDAPSAPAAEPVGDYDQTDPGTTAFDSVQLASAADAAKTTAPATATTPADSAGAAPAAGSTTPAPSTAPASSGDAAATTAPQPQAGQPTDAASPASAPTSTSNNQAAAAVAPAQPTFTQDQINRAAQLGWSPEVLGTFTNPELGLLQAEKLALNALLAGQRQALAAIPQGQQAPAQQTQQAQQSAQPQPLVPPPAFDEAATRQFWTDQGFDPLVVNQQVEAARTNHAHASQLHQMAVQNQGLSQQLQHLTRFLGEQQAQRQTELVQHQNEIIQRDFESFRATLPAEVGKSIDPATQNQIFRMAEVIVRGHLQAGTQPQQMPDNKALFTQATVAVLGFDKMSAIARDQVRQEVKQHQDVRIARPTSGGKPHQSPDDAASSYAEQWWSQHVGATGNAGSAPEV